MQAGKADNLLGPDRQLDLSASRPHSLKSLRQVRQADFLGHKVASRNIPATDGFESFTDKSRRVVKR